MDHSVLSNTVLIPVLGTASFFLSPQSANPQPNFNFLNLQPQVRNWTFKSLVRNDFLRFLNPQQQVRNFLILEVRNFVIFEVRTASLQLFMNRVKKFCNQPHPEVNCSELIGKSCDLWEV